MLQFLLLLNRQGSVRLRQFYSAALVGDKDQQLAIRDVHRLVLGRPTTHSNFVSWRDYTVVYRRFAALYAVVAIDKTDNELMALEVLQRYIQILDSYFGNVCELDIVFHFEQAYHLLDELVGAGEMHESSIDAAVRFVSEQDAIEDDAGSVTGLMGTIATRLGVRDVLGPAQITDDDKFVSRESALRGVTPPAMDGAPTKVRFEVEGTLDSGRHARVVLVMTPDSLEMRNAQSNVVERAWSYGRIKRWATGPSSFTVDLGKTGADLAAKYVSFSTVDGEAISMALGRAVRAYAKQAPPGTL